MSTDFSESGRRPVACVYEFGLSGEKQFRVSERRFHHRESRGGKTDAEKEKRDSGGSAEGQQSAECSGQKGRAVMLFATWVLGGFGLVLLDGSHRRKSPWSCWRKTVKLWMQLWSLKTAVYKKDRRG